MRVVRPLLLALGATALAVGVGVAVVDDEEPTTPTTVEEPSVPLTDFDTTQLVARRTAFCGDVPDRVVTEALDGDPAAETAYGNGDRVKVAGGSRDVAHEFSCSWNAPDGTVARAWVFAPPVTPERARSLVTGARKTDGCAPVAGAPAYGVPSLALVCEKGDTRVVSHRGLFGDAWLTCELTAPASVARAAQQDRAGRWCVGIATAVQVTG